MNGDEYDHDDSPFSFVCDKGRHGECRVDGCVCSCHEAGGWNIEPGHDDAIVLPFVKVRA